jgi:purine nucleosidase
VIHDHDGHVDDLVGCVLLWLSPAIDLQAVGVTNGDCYVEQAFESVIKIATYLDLEGPEIALSDLEVENQFPETWRRESFIINELPLFTANDLKRPYTQGRPRKSKSVYADCLAHSRQPVTIVATGPLTNIATLLREEPSLLEKIGELIIMGGALAVPGNVHKEGFDATMEWNLFSDPHAFKAVLETKIPIKLVPLDATNHAPITKAFLDRLELQSEGARASMLASRLWSLVSRFEYYFWGSLTSAIAIDPSIAVFKDAKIDIALSGKNLGRISTSLFSGRKIKLATNIAKDKFENLMLELLRSR